MLTINEEITLENQQERISALLPQGCRFVTMTAVDSSTHFDIYYHFDRSGELYTLRLKLGREEALPSISGLCFAALLVENEIQDLFGIAVTGLVLDYHRHLLLTKEAPVKPFCRVPGVSVSTVESGKGGDK